MFCSKKQKHTTYVIFMIYILLLIWLILFKLSTDFSELYGYRNINLIPFHYDIKTNIQLKESIFNVLVYIPFGVYIRILRSNDGFLKNISVIFISSLIFEVLQYIFSIGASDITDIINNTSGGFIGILLCQALKKVLPEKYIDLFNLLGIITVIFSLSVFILLYIANI